MVGIMSFELLEGLYCNGSLTLIQNSKMKVTGNNWIMKSSISVKVNLKFHI